MADKLLFAFVGECHNGPAHGIRMADLFQKKNGSVYIKCRKCKHVTKLTK